MRAPDDLLVHLRRARDLIDRDFAEPLDLATMAAAANVSKYHFRSMGGIGLTTDDCQKDDEELTAKGVEFPQPPSERPYGVEAVMRDNSGNWIVLVEHRPFTGEDFPHA